MSPFVRSRSVRHGDRLLARAVFLLALALYTATFVGIPDNHDAEVEFQTVRSLYHHRNMALSGTPEAQIIIDARFDVREGAGDRAGKYYSWFGVGQALVALPFFALGHGLAQLFPEIQALHETTTHYGDPRSEYFEHLLVGWRNPLLGALTALLVVLAARRVGVSRPSAFFAGIGYALCTFAWPQARSTLSDVQASFFLFLSLHLILLFRETFERYHQPRLLHLAALGASLGLAFLTRVVVAPAIAVLLVLFVLVLWRARHSAGKPSRRVLELCAASVPALACVALFLVVNLRRFGDPLETGYSDAVFSGTFFNFHPLLGLKNLLVAPGKGLVWLAPPILLALFGIVRLWRRGDRLVLFGGLLFACAIVAPIMIAETWHGAWTYGPRYVLPLLAVLWLFVAQGMDLLAQRLHGRLVIALLFLFGLLANLPGVLVDHMTHQELALQAMRIEWPDPPGTSELERDNQRFQRMQCDWRYAAPWAHWRIFRHRISAQDESFPVRELFFLDSDARVTPARERDKGFRHLAWVDMNRRLEVPSWPAWVLCLGLLVLSASAMVRGFDPTRR
jgi:hypothetical protein